MLFPDAYSTEDLVLKWKQDDPVEVNDELELPQFDLINTEHMDCTRHYTTGGYKDMLYMYYMHGDVCSTLKYYTSLRETFQIHLYLSTDIIHINIRSLTFAVLRVNKQLFMQIMTINFGSSWMTNSFVGSLCFSFFYKRKN